MSYTNNELKRRYFRIEITNPNTSATGAKAGFVDSMKFQDYTDFNPTDGAESKYTAKALGYIRWCNLILALSQFGVFYSDVNELTDATALLTPSKIIFTMGYEQADNMYIKDDGEEFTDVDALKQIIAKVLSQDYQLFATVYNPSLDQETRGGKRLPSGGPIGFREKFLKAEKICDTVEDALDYIEVSELGKLTIEPLPSDATVTLTASGHTQEGHTIFVDSGDTVEYTVSKEGLTDKSGSVVVTNEKIIKVELQ